VRAQGESRMLTLRHNTMNDRVDEGAAIILISSEIEEILGMSDRILVLAGGRIAAEMERGAATKEKILEFATKYA